MLNIYRSDGALLLLLKTSSTARADHRATVQDVKLASADLNSGIFQNVVFSGGTFDGAQCVGAKLQDVEFEAAWLCEGNFSHSQIKDVEFYDVEGHGLNFSNAILSDVCFYGSNLSFAKFSGAALCNVRFRSDNIGHKTNISGANLSSLDLSRVAFEGVVYDDFTQFPESFDVTNCKGLQRER